MDRTPRRSCRARASFPRTRGDGPNPFRWHWRLGLFPPHTRGWTVQRPLMRSIGAVSPAHAGMDRWSSSVAIGPSRFPRTRGDGPVHRAEGHARDAFPPHTRGWTLLAAPEVVGHFVSPAHAGMDRRHSRLRPRRKRFPRTRGDGPRGTLPGGRPRTFPPHTRGMDRTKRAQVRGATRFPAHAGMDPGWTGAVEEYGRFPRTRGDGPPLLPAPRLTTAFPPHTRGWTVRVRFSSCLRKVSPAHAGMDPTSKSSPSRSASFPRTRGDGPPRPG